MTKQPKDVPGLEPTDPVAYPHYPKRPLRASRPIFEIIEERFDEQKQQDD